MKNGMTKILAFLLVTALALSLTGCKVLHEKVVDLVVRNSVCMDFDENHETASYVGDPVPLNVATQIDDALASLDDPLTRDDIRSAKLTAASFRVNSLPEDAPDWVVGGRLMISYNQQESEIAAYSSVRLADAFDPKYIDLNETGVGLFNDALEDYLNHADPTVIFWVEGDTCVPDPEDEGENLVFNWTGCLKMYVISELNTEVVDLFGGD
ncbi:MAG: hypothetical protein JXA57_16270 [Armatimonadetes bacterium]|nr:hypothetical protein [Armatimonadota bacterium]